MDRKTVLAAAGALVLTVVGGISALAIAFGGSPTDSGGAPAADATDSTIVVTEYVDQFGNPISGPDALATGSADAQAGFAFAEQPMFMDPSPRRSTAPTTEGTVTAAADTATATGSPSSDTYSGSDDQYEGSDDEYEGSDDDQYEGSSQGSDDDQYEGSDDEHEGGDD